MCEVVVFTVVRCVLFVLLYALDLPYSCVSMCIMCTYVCVRGKYVDSVSHKINKFRIKLCVILTQNHN